jgi:hypothetical protein
VARDHRAHGWARCRRLAGCARGDLVECVFRRDHHPLRRLPRGWTALGRIPVSELPLMLHGDAIEALIVGGGPVATRKARRY